MMLPAKTLDPSFQTSPVRYVELNTAKFKFLSFHARGRREIYTPCMHREKPTLGKRKKKNTQAALDLSLSGQGESCASSLSALCFVNFDILCSFLFMPDEWKHESSASNAESLFFSCFDNIAHL